MPRPLFSYFVSACLPAMSCCAAATAASTLPSVLGFACRCQALKLNTFFIAYTQRGAWETEILLLFLLLLLCKALFVAYFCASGRSSCGFSHILLSHPPPPPCDCIIFRKYSLGFILHDLLWFPLLLPSPSFPQTALHFQCHTLIFALVSQPVAACVAVCVRVCACGSASFASVR